MQLVLHNQIPEDEGLCRQWNKLVQQMERPEVFYTYQWALAVSRAYRASLSPLLFLGYEDNSLVGLVALAHDARRQETFFLAGSTADYCDFVSHPQCRGELVDKVFTELRKQKKTVVRLANLPADGATSVALPAAGRKNGYLFFSRPAYLCAQVVFHSAEERESVKHSVESKQMVRRSIKAMGKIGPVEMHTLESWEDISRVLPEFSQAHIARFLSTGRISNLARPERRVFLTELAHLLAQSGWIALSRLTVGERAAAWNYGFRFGGSWFWYQPTIDSELQRYSPGFCLLTKIVTRACDSPDINRVDLGLGAEEYKERFATEGRQTLHVIAATSVFVRIREELRYQTAVAIKSAPRLESFTRGVLARTSAWRNYLRAEGGLSLLLRLWRRATHLLFGRSEVFFYEWPQGGRAGAEHPSALQLRAVDRRVLADAVMQFDGDSETMQFLLRSAGRLSSQNVRGLALVTAEGEPKHFSWVADFEGFYMAELDHKLNAPFPESVLLFDCWTPHSERGHGYYGLAISRIAAQLKSQGKIPWIFSASTNLASVRGVEKAGFVRRFSLIRKRTLLWSRVVLAPSVIHTIPVRDASAAD